MIKCLGLSILSVMILISFSSCSTIHKGSYKKKPPSNLSNTKTPKPPPVSQAAIHNVKLSPISDQELLLRILVPDLIELKQRLQRFIHEKNNLVVALLAMLGMWLSHRLFMIERARPHTTRLSTDEIALFRLSKNLINDLWDRIKPDRKVTRLDDWKR